MPMLITEEESAHVDHSLTPIQQAVELATLRAHQETDSSLRRLKDHLARAQVALEEIRDAGVDVTVTASRAGKTLELSPHETFTGLDIALSLTVDMESY